MPNLKKIPVEDLRIGMYVAKLDRDWLETPFLLQGFHIGDTADVRVVARYCEYVWIDAKRGPGPLVRDGVPAPGGWQSAPLIEHQHPMEAEHKRIQAQHSAARDFTLDMHGAVRGGGVIDTGHAASTVDECVSSVLRNPDALLWMSKIRRESEYTAEHSLNVCILAVVFGRHLGMSQRELELLGLCGLLHDIGKMRVPLDILDKPGALTTKEMNMMKAHTVHGRNLLLSTPSVEPAVIEVAYSHHERIDGGGYPRKMPGDQIAYFSRIISIVDAYDAMTADRCYSQAKATTHALKIIYEERGKQFDEGLAIEFIKTIGLFPVGSIVELYSGDVGIVIETNPRLRHLPRVILVLDAEHEKYRRYKIVDLCHIEEGDLSTQYLIKKVLPDGSYGVRLKQYQEEGVLLSF